METTIHTRQNRKLIVEAWWISSIEFTDSTDKGCDPKQVMGYYDGNTVTALWNYAHRFAMSDNFYSSTFGPSTPGALNLVSGQTHSSTLFNVENDAVNGTLIGDAYPTYDDCSKGGVIVMSGKNVGDLMNARGITWGWFSAGFKTSNKTAEGKAVCDSKHVNMSGENETDYLSSSLNRFNTTNRLLILVIYLQPH